MIVKTRALKSDEPRRYIAELKRAAGSQLPYAAIAALAIGIGARIGEVLAIRNGDVLNEDGTVRQQVRRKVLKQRSGVLYREAPFVDPDLREIVQRYADSLARKSRWFDADGKFFCCRWSGAPLSYRVAWGRNRRFLRRAGIDPSGIAFHGLRKTFLTAVYRQVYADSGDMLKALTCVQRMAGHKSINTTIAYLDISEVNEEQTISAALKKLWGEKSGIMNIEMAAR